MKRRWWKALLFGIYAATLVVIGQRLLPRSISEYAAVFVTTVLFGIALDALQVKP